MHREDAWILVEVPVPATDPQFCAVVAQWLVRLGYEVAEEHPELDKSITKLIAQLPENNQRRALEHSLETILQTASRLEKTLMLDLLERATTSAIARRNATHPFQDTG